MSNLPSRFFRSLYASLAYAGIAVLSCQTTSADDQTGNAPSPSLWGVCAHLGWSEFDNLEEELDLMQQAGIGWVRADFSWGNIEPKDGQFVFDRYDRVVEAAGRRGIAVLPILDYNSPWAGLAHEHLDLWQRYVRTVVSRYARKVRVWEVWNEENIGFWKPKPNPKQYARLLRATYQTIKSIDRDLLVMFGGLAGIAPDFVGQAIEAGARDSFDVLAIHPYCYPQSIEKSGRIQEFRELQRVLREAGRDQIPVWITEVGWPTHRDPGPEEWMDLWVSLILKAAELTFPGRREFEAAVVIDPDWPFALDTSRALAAGLQNSGRCFVRRIRWEDVAGLNPTDTHILVGPLGERFPKAAYPAMREFVRRGGLLVHIGGVPLYYAMERTDDGWTTRPPGSAASEDFRRNLHIGWEAWWTRKGLPKSVPQARPAKGITGIRMPKRPVQTTRWFTPNALHPGDRFIPLLEAFDGDHHIGYPSVLFQLDSDLKGGVLVNCLPLPVKRGVDRETQARMAFRAYLTWAAYGVRKVFWYEFRDGGLDPEYNEHNFGLIDFHLKPKPAWRAVRYMTKVFGPTPRFEGPPEQTREGAVVVRVRATNGRLWTVCWADDPDVVVLIDAPAGGFEAADFLGRRVPLALEAGRVRVPAGKGPIFIAPLDRDH